MKRLFITILCIFAFALISSTAVDAQYSRLISQLETLGIVFRNDSIIFTEPTNAAGVVADSSWNKASPDTVVTKMIHVKSANNSDTTYIYILGDTTIVEAKKDGKKGNVKYDANVAYAGKLIMQDTLQTLVIVGHDATEIDTFWIYEDGTNTIFKADNPIKIEETVFDDNKIFSSGAVGSNSISGAGTYFHYIPDKSSLVVGSVTGGDFDNIEAYTYVFGSNNDMNGTANSYNFLGGQDHDTGSINDHNFFWGTDIQGYTGDQFFTAFGEDHIGSAGGGGADYSFTAGKANTVQQPYMAVFGWNQYVGTSGGGYGFIWGGQNRIEVNSPFASAMGNYSKVISPGQRVFANGQFTTFGDAQYEDHILRVITANATPTAASLGGDIKSHAGAGDEYLYRLEIDITALCTIGVGAGDAASYKLIALIYDAAGSYTNKYEALTVEFEDEASWDVALDVSGVNIEVMVTGEVDHSVQWVMRVKVVVNGDES